MDVRVFLGLELAPDMRRMLGQCCEAMLGESIPWRAEKLVAEENFHVTLKFLGSVTEEAIPEIERAAARASETFDEYPLSLGEVIAIPRLRSASMLWTTIAEGAEETDLFASALESRLSAVGYERAEKPFKAHITLVRARRPRAVTYDMLDAANRLLFAAGEREKRMSVRGITLFSSTLTPRGPVYKDLAFVPLQGD